LTGGVLLLLGNLVAFKYTSFLNESLRSLFGIVRADYPLPVLQVILPIGISFYTFQLISYLVDIHRGTIKAERRPGIFDPFDQGFVEFRTAGDLARLYTA